MEGDDECFFRFQSFDHPPTVYRYAVGEGMTEIDAPEVDIETDLQVEQEWYESAVGTEIPLFVVHAGVELDGDNPTLLYAYGGLTVGASITQCPDLFAACLCVVPLLDMLRFHRFLLGASWTAECGSPGDPEAFEYIRDYSPYHNVEEESYPAVLFKTAEGDGRSGEIGRVDVRLRAVERRIATQHRRTLRQMMGRDGIC